MRWRFRKSLVKAFEPSRRAAARDGPKHARPAAAKRSTIPATSGPSGPTMVSPMSSRAAKANSPSMSSADTSMLRTLGSSAVPAFPGAAKTASTRGDCAHFHASACSRPPPPTIRIFIRDPGPLVAEVTHSGEHHRDAVLVGGGDDLGVALRSARLNDRFDSQFGDRIESIAEWEKGIRGNAGGIYIEAGVLGLQGGDLAAHHPAHLPGANP